MPSTEKIWAKLVVPHIKKNWPKIMSQKRHYLAKFLSPTCNHSAEWLSPTYSLSAKIVSPTYKMETIGVHHLPYLGQKCVTDLQYCGKLPVPE